MTLTQKAFKNWILPFVLCFSMIFAFFPSPKADAATRTFDKTLYSGTLASGACQTSYPVINQKVNITNLGGDILAKEQYWTGSEWQTFRSKRLTYYNTPSIFTIESDGEKWRILMTAYKPAHIHVDCYGSSSY
ncbi:hypothetical protein WQ54_12685 [Bacillus sp. SA1-12]|uniref:hypothetical protein n=1 Tax=Bacillus sp. SA1-12 TaxID=1455638 RepID=UPI0006251ACF|nr:hypothetical protein [Bacillus sp. SA1-12]KKI91822.1 hypothetical protein WQ54_12685 [Bacillus sp. SA1-12]